MESRKLVLIDLFAGQEYGQKDVENRHVDLGGGRGEWVELGDWD